MKFINRFFRFLYCTVPFAIVVLPIFFLLCGYQLSINNSLVYLLATFFVVPNIIMVMSLIYNHQIDQQDFFSYYFNNYIKKFFTYLKFSFIFIMVLYYFLTSIVISINLYGLNFWSWVASPLLLLLSSWFLFLIICRANTELKVSNWQVMKKGTRSLLSNYQFFLSAVFWTIMALLIVPLFGSLLQVIGIPFYLSFLSKGMNWGKILAKNEELIVNK